MSCMIWFCLQELASLKKEKESLEALRQDHRLFGDFISNMSAATRERLQLQSDRITTAQQSLSEHEKLLFDQYKQEEKLIMDKKQNIENEIEERRKKIAADRVYLKECEEKYQKQCLERSGGDTDSTRLDRERLGLEEEQLRVITEENVLNSMESSQKAETEVSLKNLQVIRSEQVDELNASRANLQQLQSSWQELVAELSQDCKGQLDKLECADQHQKDLVHIMTEFEAQKGALEVERRDLMQSLQNSVKREERRMSDFDSNKVSVQQQQVEIDEQMDQKLSKLQHRKRL